ncbi:hypothetical protein TEA_001280 [Camellia sinensis var. sinensis]|uniref:Uncharacterized protein n=1 Tax=Camellia sinensis var. sinensis TaxID=542762 RepID=A0A4S4EBL9_CAMSN|nr:hypothetical protein TEA_001280 [Camellia sinensis var. sinensis]
MVGSDGSNVGLQSGFMAVGYNLGRDREKNERKRKKMRREGRRTARERKWEKERRRLEGVVDSKRSNCCTIIQTSKAGFVGLLNWVCGAFVPLCLLHLKENGACYYTVRFTTSCSSPSYTRDQISLDFGDAYGNEVYVPRIDDPSSGTFEACSVDTFDIYGPCMYDTCYLYVYRSGYDGWKLNTVEVYGYNSVTFYYNTFIPRDVWYGFDYCNGLSAST